MKSFRNLSSYPDICRSWETIGVLVQKFAINNLTEVLRECVRCRENPREKVDQETAKDIVLRRSRYILDNELHKGTVLSLLVSHLLVLKAYHIERLDNPSLPEISSNVIDGLDESLSELDRIAKILIELEGERLSYLIDRAAEECHWDHHFTEWVLDRCVWNYFYQSSKNELPPEKYNGVIFH